MKSLRRDRLAAAMSEWQLIDHGDAEARIGRAAAGGTAVAHRAEESASATATVQGSSAGSGTAGGAASAARSGRSTGSRGFLLSRESSHGRNGGGATPQQHRSRSACQRQCLDGSRTL
jgi:hypothetical protein